MDQTLSNQVVNSIRRVIVVHQIDGPFLNGVKTPMSSQNGAQLVLSVSLSLLFLFDWVLVCLQLCMFCFQVSCYLIFFDVYITLVFLLL